MWMSRGKRASEEAVSTPVVTEYGNVAKLTQAPGSITDGTGISSQLKSCL
jgi:hypothetical protein